MENVHSEEVLAKQPCSPGEVVVAAVVEGVIDAAAERIVAVVVVESDVVEIDAVAVDDNLWSTNHVAILASKYLRMQLRSDFLAEMCWPCLYVM